MTERFTIQTHRGLGRKRHLTFADIYDGATRIESDLELDFAQRRLEALNADPAAYDASVTRAAQLAAKRQAEENTKPVRVERPADAATGRQVDYIMSLLVKRARSGDRGGFMLGPTTREGVAQMTRTDASAYIDSLRETY